MRIPLGQSIRDNGNADSQAPLTNFLPAVRGRAMGNQQNVDVHRAALMHQSLQAEVKESADFKNPHQKSQAPQTGMNARALFTTLIARNKI